MKKLFTKVTTALALSAFAFTSIDAQVLECHLEFADGTIIEVPVGAPAEGFGGELTTGQSVSGIAVRSVADFSAEDPADDDDTMGCGPITNTTEVAGNVALVNRGACFFSDKVYYAGDAGASAAIICNSNPGEGTIGMAAGGNFEGQAIIPSGFLSYEDCQTIYEKLDAGENVTVTLRVPNLFNVYGPYANKTPLSQSIILDEISLRYANILTEADLGVEMTAVVTDPSGMTTEMNAGPFDVNAEEDSIFRFDEYLPEEIGDYSIRFTNNKTQDTLYREFEITEDLFAVDNGNIEGWVSVNEEDFVNDSYVLDLGSFFLSAPDQGTPGNMMTHVSFALNNPADIYVAGNDIANTFSIVVYDMDQNDDGTIDGTTYADYGLVGFGDYSLTGEEEVDEIIMVDVMSLSGSMIELKNNGQYAVMVQYNGTEAALGIPPRFSTAGAADYPYYGSFVYTDQFYLGGWSSGTNAVVRAHVAPSTVNTENLDVLDATVINVTPNPASEVANINFDLERMAETVNYSIVNLNGQEIKAGSFDNVQTGAYTIDIQDLTSGLYILTATTPEGIRSMKLVVE